MFLTNGLWFLRDLTRQVWVRVALYSLLALVSAGIAPLVSPALPDGMASLMGRAPTLELLSILTSSMLGVATFSLSVMVVAHQFAASQATPRSHRLLREDGRTQSVLATFIGAFVFGLTSRIAVHAGIYDARDYPVIYAVTVIVTLTVIVALIRWVQQLASLGSLEKTTGRVEQATRDAMEAMATSPALGCTPLPDDAPGEGTPITATAFGYVRHIDVRGLSDCAGAGQIDILVQPGDWVGPGDILMRTTGVTTEAKILRESIVTGDLRTFDQDPIFGLQVMSEIAQRALSPSLNDPRTAIDVIKRQTGLLHLWTEKPVSEPLPGLRARRASATKAMLVAFDAIGRDGANMVEVQLNLQRAFRRLADHPVPAVCDAARTLSKRALTRSDDTLALAEDRDAVRAAAPDDHSAASR